MARQFRSTDDNISSALDSSVNGDVDESDVFGVKADGLVGDVELVGDVRRRLFVCCFTILNKA